MPDSTTITKCPKLINDNKLGEALFAQVGRKLQARGFEVITGTIVDATIQLERQVRPEHGQGTRPRNAPDPQGPAVALRNDTSHRYGQGWHGPDDRQLHQGHGHEVIPPDLFGYVEATYRPTRRLGSESSRLLQIRDNKWKVVPDYVKP